MSGQPDPATEPIPCQSLVDSPMSSALAGHDDMVGYQSTPMFDALAAQLGGDPRGMEVKSWKEISYAHGRRSVGDREGGGAGGAGFTAGGDPGSREGTAVRHGDGVAQGG